ncbi:50S ribosomal protein L10 [Candidatus Peregrinibacteria bacterium]|jgi:large subunit ribosomal protein L10|nr:50S ribosomal protein L10 [Candidatus Peregrinibacteria bacterium]MBT4631483.1 50S ribosomal protein L10 [Candidatus Peregrinibacteria bacterium]MBT5516589.1 50S ribosomal protein L10 [Candidatus Peregrinibacteria bacterium]MBT5823872.1 50S ribosomal protein L10 [Candidatus Peregrinibacteria bacterium]
MAITKQKKEEILKELIEKFKDAQSVAFGQYSGMTVTELSDMRNKMREAGVEFKVAKKTLFKLAAKEHGLELPDEILEGTVGAAFSYDDLVSGPRLLKSTSKEVEVVKLLGGVMDGKVLSITQMGELADLPSKETLLTKFALMMRAPLQSFYGAIQAPTSGLARAFSEYAKMQPAEEAAPAAEAPAEEVKEEAPAPEAKAEEATIPDAPIEESEVAEEAPEADSAE